MKISWGLLRTFWAVVFFFSVGAPAEEFPLHCLNRLDRFGERAPQGQTVKRSLDSIRVLHLLTYNLLNLEMHVGKFEDGPTGARPVTGPTLKDPAFRHQQADILLSEKTDIGVFQEIEGMEAFDSFNRDFVGDLFEPLLKRGNDGRGIEVGMLVKRDLPFTLEYRSHRDRLWHDPVTGSRARVFSRDLPALIVRAEGSAKPLLILLGTHFRSKNDRDGDPESEIMREGQADAAAAVINGLKQEFGATVPIILAGDFNGNFNRERAFATMRRALDMEDPFNVLNVGEPERITHTYHPQGEPRHTDQLDYLLVSRNILACIKDAYVYRYKDDKGRVKPIPQTKNQRKKNPSDHFPVALQLDFPCLLEQWKKN